jgi:hypothetical protein
MKHLLFLDLSQLENTVELPSDITGNITSAELVTWNFEGQPEIPLGALGRTSGFYVQLKFEGCLETRSVGNNSRPDMFPLPLRSFGDWAPTTLPLPLTVHLSPFVKRFKVSLWGEGLAPQPFQPIALQNGLRLLMWIVLQTDS